MFVTNAYNRASTIHANHANIMMGMDQQVMERDAAAQRNIDMRELADLLAWKYFEQYLQV